MTAENNDSYQRRQMQRGLYQSVRNNLYPFPNLYEKVYRPYVLKEAWVQVKAKRARLKDDIALQKAEAYGIDKLLGELRSELKHEKYRVVSFCQESMDQDLTQLKNDIAQTAVKIIISPIFKAAYATRSKQFRSQHDLTAEAEKIRASYYDKDYCCLKIHIRSCFDSINRDKLLELLEHKISDQELLYLIRHLISSGSIYRNDSSDREYGIDKNLIIAPLLMSIYLRAMDNTWENQYKNLGIWLRYKDQVILLYHNRESYDRILTLLISFLGEFDIEPEVVDTDNDYCISSAKVHPTLPKSPSTLKKDSEMATAEYSNESFCGYKYRFGLYAAHSNVNESNENTHFHNFTITLYIHAGTNTDDNYGVEKAIQDWLAPLQGKQLCNSSLFLGKETTIEGIGDTLLDPLFMLIQELGYELVKLSIYDNPLRVYSVSYKRLDSTVNTISDIPLGCIPLLNLEEEFIAAEPSVRESEAELLTAAAKELIDVPGSEVKTVTPVAKLNEEEHQKAVELILENTSDIELETGLKFQDQKHYILISILKCLLGLGCITALAVLTMFIVKDSGRYPQGSDTFCHLYRADLLLKNFQQGNWFPLYDGTWYNGVEIMRYWGPLPLYLLAGLEWIIQSSILNAYILFLGVLLIIGGCGWLLWGITYRRIGLSVLIGLIWFYMPENMRVVILEGNLPRGVINALLPFFFYFLWKVIAEKRKTAIFPLVFITSLITLCHLGITLMLIAATIIFILVHSSLNHVARSSLCALGATLSGVLLAGMWVVPALIGGAASGSSTNQVMKFFFESIFVSLNPLTRINGDMLSFYFGLSIFIICIFGMLCGPKNTKAGFITAMILLICTSKSVYELFIKLPFSQFLWMIRFIPIGLATAMVSFLLWKQLKKWAVLLLALLLVADCSTSYKYIYYPPEYRIADVEANLDNRAEEALIKDAKNITKQRMALMDLSEYGSFAPYYITGIGDTVNYTFGAGWEGAATASNIVQLNASVESGWYIYLFDRALELGNDTVLVPIDNLKEKAKDIGRLIEAASISGYDLVKNDGTSILFHREAPEQFGVISHYEAIAIGDAASYITMIFPCFEEGLKADITKYSFEELSSYRTIYLSGFTYKDKTAAEELLEKLAKSGVQIYIDMNRVPVDPIKKSMELFGVTSQGITLSDSFPEFIYKGASYTSLDFSYDVGEWNTVYLLGLDKVDGSCNMTNKILPFLGTTKHKNLHFIGLNITYYLQMTRDSEIQKLAEAIFQLNGSSVPERKVVPISIQKKHNQISIQTDYDNVNTTLSYLDIFQSDQEFEVDNNLITLDSGTTVLKMKYPHAEKGLAVTVIGIILAILSFVLMRRRKECMNHE